MIIFFDKRTLNIFGVIEGRVHDRTDLLIKPNDIDESDIGKFVVPFIPIYGDDGELLDMKADVGDMEQQIYDFESKKEDIYEYKVILSEQKEVTGFIKNAKINICR